MHSEPRKHVWLLQNRPIFVRRNLAVEANMVFVSEYTAYYRVIAY